MHVAPLLFVLGVFSHPAESFQLTSSVSSNGGGGYDEFRRADSKKNDAVNRRSFMEDFLGKALVGFSLVNLPVASPMAYASGGATAGGAYLLSAKQRYNKRVLAGVKSFLHVDARNLNELNAFFESTDEGGWEDLSAAGYLLSNAFRTSSTKAPDSLPSVKKWKAFAKEMELLKKALSKKDSGKVFTAYKIAEETLDAYLDAVELPSGMELKNM